MMAKKKEERMIVRCFSMDRKLSESIDDYAKSQDRSISWIVREALKKFIPLKYYNDLKGILRERK